MFSHSLDKNSEEGLLDHMAIQLLIFKENSILFSIVGKALLIKNNALSFFNFLFIDLRERERDRERKKERVGGRERFVIPFIYAFIS